MKYQNGIETRNIILEESRKLFLSNGFHETTIREIAKKSNITSGTLYKHFENKEDILHAIIDPYIEEWWESCNLELEVFESKIKSLIPLEKTNIDFINKVLCKNDSDSYISLIEKDIEVWRLILFKSHGTKYETFLDDIIEWEYTHVIRFFDMMFSNRSYFNNISNKELKFILKLNFKAIFSTFEPDFTREERLRIIQILHISYIAIFQTIFKNFFKELELE